MRSLFEKKPWVLLISIFALGALTILAAGLGRIPFQDAQPLIRTASRGGGFDARGVLDAWMEIPIWMQAGVWMAVILIVVLIGALLSPEARRLLIRTIIRIAITYWVLFFLFKRYGDQLALQALKMLDPGLGAPAPPSDVPSPVFTPNQNMVWASYALSFIIILIAAFISWRTYKFWMKFREQGGKGALHKIADIARASIRDLSSGRDSTDVIMNCYFRMSDAVADKRNLLRRDSMTPGEFATRLEQAGLPGDAVRRLTRLFESVRYGARKSGQAEINEAIVCLNTILAYCGEVS